MTLSAYVQSLSQVQIRPMGVFERFRAFRAPEEYRDIHDQLRKVLDELPAPIAATPTEAPDAFSPPRADLAPREKWHAERRRFQTKLSAAEVAWQRYARVFAQRSETTDKYGGVYSSQRTISAGMGYTSQASRVFGFVSARANLAKAAIFWGEYLAATPEDLYFNPVFRALALRPVLKSSFVIAGLWVFYGVMY